MTNDQAVFEKDGNKKERISLSGDVKYVYNGRYVAVPASADKKTSYGQYRFVDNNGDDDADVVFVEQAESFIVDKVNEKNTTVYFANKEYFRGKNGFKFDYEEKDNQYEIVDTKGNALSFADIRAGDGISLIASRDETYVKAVISRDSVSGTISSILDDNIIGIDGTESVSYTHLDVYKRQVLLYCDHNQCQCHQRTFGNDSGASLSSYH